MPLIILCKGSWRNDGKQYNKPRPILLGGGPASADRKRWMLFWHLRDNGLRDGFKQAKTDKRNTRMLG